MTSTNAREETARPESAAREAWWLLFQIAMAHRSRFFACLQELELTPPQAHALRTLEPGRALAMSELADRLVCDASNVTGIVDRLELRGLVERRSEARDRRVKTLVVTPAGEVTRRRVLECMSEPPPGFLALPERDLRALRDIAERALALSQPGERGVERPPFPPPGGGLGQAPGPAQL